MEPPPNDIQTPEEAPTWALESTNLANERLGATVIFTTDEWFGESLFLLFQVFSTSSSLLRFLLLVCVFSSARTECFLDPSPATFDPDDFSSQGKVTCKK
jgi:hypothetical protein